MYNAYEGCANALTSPPKVCLSCNADVVWNSLVNESVFRIVQFSVIEFQKNFSNFESLKKHWP